MADMGRAAREGWRFGAKLVRGAYMVQERARAAERGYLSPIYDTKQATDANYDRCGAALSKTIVALCIHLSHIQIELQPNNQPTCMLAAAYRGSSQIQPPDSHTAELPVSHNNAGVCGSGARACGQRQRRRAHGRIAQPSQTWRRLSLSYYLWCRGRGRG